MKKMPTLYLRPSATNPEVGTEVNPEAAWVFNDTKNVTARVKYDGTACMIDGNRTFWKRRTVRPNQKFPRIFIKCTHDKNTGKTFGWVPVENFDAFHREAWDKLDQRLLPAGSSTYELVGPKINGNPHQLEDHNLLPHDLAVQLPLPNVIEQAWLAFQLETHPIEGVVFTHNDGRRAKIKRTDFGFNWPLNNDQLELALVSNH